MAVLRIGLVQLRARRSKSESREAIKALLERSRVEADLIALPEYAMFDPTGVPPEHVAREAEQLDGPWVDFISWLAGQYSAYVVATLFEAGPRKPYNTAIVVSPGGSVVYTYRKLHLFDAYGYRESSYFTPGSTAPKPVEVKGVKLGIAICFDIRFPELFRLYALQGAQLAVVPSAWYRGPLKEEILRFLAQARAHENTMYVALPVLYGERFTGRSMLVNPLGVVEVDAGPGERYVEGIIDTSTVEQARKELPVLRLVRGDVYGLPRSRASS
jgi:predicted amidohydrolase